LLFGTYIPSGFLVCWNDQAYCQNTDDVHHNKIPINKCSSLPLPPTHPTPPHKLHRLMTTLEPWALQSPRFRQAPLGNLNTCKTCQRNLNKQMTEHKAWCQTAK
jgi:hypothetical protein